MWQVVTAAGLAVIVQDFLSAVLHIWLDRLGTPSTPVVGRMVAGFRRHHAEPAAIVGHGAVGNLTDTAWFSLLMALLAFGVPLEHWAARFAAEVLLGVSVFSLVTQQVHAFAHHPRPPGWVRLLQRCRVMIPPHVHARHHRGTHDSHYAVLNGWTNSLIDRLRLAEWLAPLRQ